MTAQARSGGDTFCSGVGAIGARALGSDMSHLTALVVGAAREGTVLARCLSEWGARVILSDSKPREALESRLAGLDGLDLELALGQAEPNLFGVDVLFVSPGVPPTASVVAKARSKGIPISSEPRLFTQLCGSPIIGITGSSGKTTTTSLVGEMMAADGSEVWVGGNIGEPLLGRLLGSTLPDVAVMELSSFQLELFDAGYQGPDVESRRSSASRSIDTKGRSPHVAAITNVTPNHLDRHPSMAAYVRAKKNILRHQGPDDWAILNLESELVRPILPECRGRVLGFRLDESGDPVEAGGEHGHVGGASVRGKDIILRDAVRERVLCQVSDVRLRGRHNLANILAAACCAMAGGCGIEAMREVATGFTGVPHRLEEVRLWRGVLMINDSIATSPERAIAAIQSYTEPLILLAGGRDKHLPWDAWGQLVLDRVQAVIAFGEAAPIVEKALSEARAARAGDADAGPHMHLVDSMDEAVVAAAGLARAGDVVLLSPGGTSFDAFEDYEARGKRFRELVAAL